MINLLFFNFFFVKCEYLELPKVYSFAPCRFEIRRFWSYRNIKKTLYGPKGKVHPKNGLWPLD